MDRTLAPARERGCRVDARTPAAAAWLAALTLLFLLLAAAPASAHASFVASSPEPGADLAAAPGVVTLRFSEPLIDDLSSVTVIDPTGQQFTSGPTGDREIEVDVNSTVQGQYTVEWKTVSPIDGHTLHGSFSFGVGAAVGHQDDPSDAPTASDLVVGAARGLEYVGLLGALGLLALASAAARARTPWAPHGLHRWVAAAALGGLLTVAGELLVATSGASLAALRSFMVAPSGLPRLARLVAEGAAVAVAVSAVRRSGDGVVRPRAARVGTTLLLLASLGLVAAAGHAAAAGTAGVVVDAAHLWSAALWAGPLLVMAVQRPPEGWRSDIGGAVLREFSPIALIGFVVTVLSGSVRGWQELAAVSDLWTSAYGQVLGLKVLLVAAMAPLSVLAWRRRRTHPRTEGALAVAVVLAAAVLAAFPVPPGRAGDEASQEVTETQGLPQPGDLTMAGDAGSTVVGMTVRPAEPGINDVYVHLVPPGGSEDAAGRNVLLTVDDGEPQAMNSCGDPCRVATVTLDGGEQLAFEVAGDDAEHASIRLPDLPAPDGIDLAAALIERMQQVATLRYDEVFGPMDPPVTSTWEIVAPDRIHGIIRDEGDYREIIRIEDRRWSRQSPDGDWTGGEPGGPAVDANQFIWDYPDKIAARIIGTDTVDGLETQVVSFLVNLDASLPIWYRLWVDEDHLVHRAEMRTRGHFMDHHYFDHGGDVEITPPGDQS